MPTRLEFLCPDPFVLEVTVQAREIDEFAHVNNVVYLGWMARCAWAHSKALGFDFAAYEKADCGFVVRRHEIDYKRPCFIDERVSIATWISQNDRRLRLRRRFQILRTDTGEERARGLSDFVTMRLSSGKACKMPPAFADGYPAQAQVESAFTA